MKTWFNPAHQPWFDLAHQPWFDRAHQPWFDKACHNSAGLLVSLLLVLFVIGGCGSNSRPEVGGDKVRELANEFYSRYLFEQAIEQYRYYLEHYSVSQEERANISYQIGNIYFERLHDYQNALAEFLKIRSFYPESKIIADVNKKVIACLERLQRPEDAQQALRESADLVPPEQKSRPGTVIAKIGDREVSQGDLDFEISQLPIQYRSQYQTVEKKLEFLRQYVATELLYDSAKRQSLENDKDVLANLAQAKKSFMVEKLLQQEISKKVKIEEPDIDLYYEANKEKYAEKDKNGKVVRQPALAEIKQRVAQDLVQERQQRAYQELVSSLLRADNVKIYDDLVK